MTNEEIRDMLQEIKNMINQEDNEKVVKYINKKITKLLAEENPTADYLDGLVKQLK